MAQQVSALADGKVFVSTEQTGTGASQNVAHDLGKAPKLVLVVPTGWSAAGDIAEGTHTAANVVVTVTTGVTFKVWAFA